MAALGWAGYRILMYIVGRDSRGIQFVNSDDRLIRANAIVAYVRYLIKMVRFDRLAIFYPRPTSVPNGQVVLCGMLLAAITLLAFAAAIVGGRRYRYLPVGWLWFLGALFPMIGILNQIGDFAMADRYSYLPCIGLLLMIFWSVPERFWPFQSPRPDAASAAVAYASKGAFKNRLPPIQWGTIVACAGILATLFFFTRVQVAYWKDDIALFGHAMAVTDNNVPARINLAYHVIHQNDLAQAERLLREAAQIDPESTQAWNGIGEICRSEGRLPEAIDAFTKAEHAQQYDPTPHRKLGDIFAGLHRDSDAIREYKLSLRNDRDRLELHEALRMLYARSGKSFVVAPSQTTPSSDQIVETLINPKKP